MKEIYIIPQLTTINKLDRIKLNNHLPVCIWFTGLSGSGKSTISNSLEQILYDMKAHTYLLDGDNIRSGLNKDLFFSEKDREENIRRISETAKLFVDAGLIVLSAFISPYKKSREFSRSLFNPNEFIEIYVKCPLSVCENRDIKGLYKKARDGIIQNFTGISDPYEEPENPEIIIDTSIINLDDSVKIIMDFLIRKKIIT